MFLSVKSCFVDDGELWLPGTQAESASLTFTTVKSKPVSYTAPNLPEFTKKLNLGPLVLSQRWWRVSLMGTSEPPPFSSVSCWGNTFISS